MHSGGSQKRILIIDDDAGSRLLAKKVLEGKGYLVLEAPGVVEGLKAAEQFAPHLIIVDLMMPVKTGFDFLEARIKHSVLKTVPTMVMSSLKDTASIYRASSLGSLDYITKPIDSRILIQKVFKALQSAHHPIKRFEAKSRPSVSVYLQARISLANEVGFLLETPAKLGESTRPKIASSFLVMVGCENSILMRTERPAKYYQQGNYLNEIAVVGLAPEAVERIRNLLRGVK